MQPITWTMDQFLLVMTHTGMAFREFRDSGEGSLTKEKILRLACQFGGTFLVNKVITRQHYQSFMDSIWLFMALRGLVDDK